MSLLATSDSNSNQHKYERKFIGSLVTPEELCFLVLMLLYCAVPQWLGLDVWFFFFSFGWWDLSKHDVNRSLISCWQNGTCLLGMLPPGTQLACPKKPRPHGETVGRKWDAQSAVPAEPSAAARPQQPPWVSRPGVNEHPRCSSPVWPPHDWKPHYRTTTEN